MEADTEQRSRCRAPKNQSQRNKRAVLSAVEKEKETQNGAANGKSGAKKKERTAEVVDKANTERRGKQRYDMETPVKRRKRKEQPSAKQDQANI